LSVCADLAPISKNTVKTALFSVIKNAPVSSFGPWSVLRSRVTRQLLNVSNSKSQRHTETIIGNEENGTVVRVIGCGRLRNSPQRARESSSSSSDCLLQVQHRCLVELGINKPHPLPKVHEAFRKIAGEEWYRAWKGKESGTMKQARS